MLIVEDLYQVVPVFNAGKRMSLEAFGRFLRRIKAIEVDAKDGRLQCGVLGSGAREEFSAKLLPREFAAFDDLVFAVLNQNTVEAAQALQTKLLCDRWRVSRLELNMTYGGPSWLGTYYCEKRSARSFNEGGYSSRALCVLGMICKALQVEQELAIGWDVLADFRKALLAEDISITPRSIMRELPDVLAPVRMGVEQVLKTGHFDDAMAFQKQALDDAWKVSLYQGNGPLPWTCVHECELPPLDRKGVSPPSARPWKAVLISALEAYLIEIAQPSEQPEAKSKEEAAC